MDTRTRAIGVLDLTADAALLSAVVTEVRVFAGYAGWDAEQIMDEITQGAWFVVDAEPGDVMSGEPERLWREVLERQPDPLRRVALYPPDLSLN